MKNFEHAAQTLTALMEEQGLTAAELSRRTEVNAGTIRNIMTGKQTNISTRNICEASNPVPTPLLGHRCRSSQEITGSPTPFSTSNHYLWICASASFSLSNPNIAA